MAFAESLKKALKEAGMTQSELAKKAGIPRSTLSQYASGAIRSPAPETLERISKALGGALGPTGGAPGLEAERHSGGLTVREAARLMGKSVVFVQEGLKARVLPFGWAVKMPSGRWSYWISPASFEEATGIKLDKGSEGQ